MASPVRSRIARRLLIAACILLLLVAALAGATLSRTPAVKSRPRPTAAEVIAARDAVQQVRDAQAANAPTVDIQLDNRKLDGLIVLAGDATGIPHVDAQIEKGQFSATASVALPLGFWLNGGVDMGGTQLGFPRFRSRLGMLRLPEWAGRPLVQVAASLLRWRGVPVPDLDETVQGVIVRNQVMVARLKLGDGLGGGGGLTHGLLRLKSAPVDDRVVAKVYCALTATQKSSPQTLLTTQLRRAFAVPGLPAGAEGNRAAFIALAMFTVAERADDLSPDSEQLAKRCGPPLADVLTLGGRVDLAKHWALSAALSAMLGTDAAGALGEWKELSDSVDGTGFSFVDLAADRSGMHVARRATDAGTAIVMRAKLREAEEGYIFPLALLQGREGMTDKQFEERYKAIDAKAYRETVDRIDAELRDLTLR